MPEREKERRKVSTKEKEKVGGGGPNIVLCDWKSQVVEIKLYIF